MEEFEDNISLHNIENWKIPKPVSIKSPDLNDRKAIWVEEERATFYFKKDATDEYIKERLEKYKLRKYEIIKR